MEPKRWALLETIGIAGTFAVLGMVIASIGPTQLAMAAKLQIPIESVGFLFPLRSVGYATGSLIGGPAVNKIPGNKLLAGSMAAVVIGTLIFPVGTSLFQLAIAMLLQGTSMGILDTAGNVFLVWVHEDKVAPYMQFIHFAFAAGGLVAPLVINAFRTYNSVYNSFYFMAFMGMLPLILLINLKDPKKRVIDEPVTTKEEEAANIRRDRLIIGACGAAILFVYVGGEVSYGGYIALYAVEFMGMTDADGDYMTACFWAGLSIMRFASIGIAAKFSPLQMLVADMVGLVLSSLVIVAFPSSTFVLWVGSFMVGVTMASVFPTVMNYVEHKIQLTGFMVTALVIGSASGEAAQPLLIQSILNTSTSNYKYRWLPVIILIGALLQSGLIAFMHWWATRAAAYRAFVDEQVAAQQAEAGASGIGGAVPADPAAWGHAVDAPEGAIEMATHHGAQGHPGEHVSKVHMDSLAH